MASVFHYCKRQKTGSYLSSIARAGGTQDLDARSQLDKLMKEVRTHGNVYNKIDFLSSPKAIAKLEIYKPDPSPQLWILLGKDGGIGRAHV